MRRPWRSAAAHWLALHGLLSLLSYRTQNYQSRGGMTPVGLCQIDIKVASAPTNPSQTVP